MKTNKTRKYKKTASGSGGHFLPIGETRDLFDQVRVLEDDLRTWCAAVAPHVLGAAWRFDWYCRGWDVPGKVRAAKISGHWPPRHV